MTKDEIITQDDILNFCIDENICYIKTDYFYKGQINWRGKLHPQTISDVCVIGHSDYEITDDIAKKFNLIFCINRNTDSDNVFGIPLGLTSDCDDSPLHRIYGNKDILIETSILDTQKKHLAYINFNVNTNFSERKNVFNRFNNFDWVNTGQISNTLEGRKKYLVDIKESKFVFCPKGNGIDTHRLWESLYMGSIPIVIYHKTHHLMRDLPILFIDDWSQITEEFLNKTYDEFINRKWNYEKLKNSYWKEFIKKNINEKKI